MREYDYRQKWTKLLTPEIVSMLTQIHEYKGEQTLFIEAEADTLTQLQRFKVPRHPIKLKEFIHRMSGYVRW